jgi:hypothetical protein
LIALDDSEGAWKGVEYVARTFNNAQGVKITLFDVLPGLPVTLWDAGHILTKEDERLRRRLAAKWIEGEKKNGRAYSEKPRRFW